MDSRQITTNHQLINPDKTKLVLLGTLQLASKLPDVTVPFLGQQLCPVSSAKDLGVTLDSGLAFNNYISLLSSSLQTSLCKISRVRHLFSMEVLYIMINSIVFSKLFYCSAVWSGTYKRNIHKTQLMQNFAARILTDTRKYDCVTWHWCINLLTIYCQHILAVNREAINFARL